MAREHPHHDGQMKHQIADEWKAYWQGQTHMPAWDYTSQIVLEVLRASIGSITDTAVLETGCGTGRISLALARAGARVSCIDISPEAAALAKRLFGEAGVPIQVSVASLFELPFPSGRFDVVWNAGVLEHFSEPERADALRELLRVVKPGGLVITLNPYRFAGLYRLGKWLAERAGKWPYGHEDPVATLTAASAGLPCRASKEYSTGFYVILIESLRVSRLFLPLVRGLRAGFVWLHRSRLGGFLRWTDRVLCRLFGGYLLVSVFRKVPPEEPVAGREQPTPEAAAVS